MYKEIVYDNNNFGEPAMNFYTFFIHLFNY